MHDTEIIVGGACELWTTRGDDDQILPTGASAISSRLIKVRASKS